MCRVYSLDHKPAVSKTNGHAGSPCLDIVVVARGWGGGGGDHDLSPKTPTTITNAPQHLPLLGLMPHMSNCRTPLLTGQPS